MHSALVCVHKCFTLAGGLKSGKCKCLWSSTEHTTEAVTCLGKIYLSHSKNRQISTSLCSKSVNTFLIMHLGTLQQHAFTNALYERVIWNLPRTNVCQTALKTQLKQLLARWTNWNTKKCYYIHCTTKKHAKFDFRMKNPQKTWFAQKSRQNFTCTWPEHSAIVTSWTLKCNASAVVVVAGKMWISQNMLWLPCSNRMSRF